MADQGVTGIKRIINAAGYSYAGLMAAFKNEAAFRQELLLVAILVPVAFWFGEGSIEKALLISSLLLVLIIELINSAIESAIDRIGYEQHEISGRAKDIGSAAVFLALINAAVIWTFLLVFQ
ncbi:MAG: diacylglycerol kinase [Arenicellales bacterium]